MFILIVIVSSSWFAKDGQFGGEAADRVWGLLPAVPPLPPVSLPTLTRPGRVLLAKGARRPCALLSSASTIPPQQLAFLVFSSSLARFSRFYLPSWNALHLSDLFVLARILADDVCGDHSSLRGGRFSIQSSNPCKQLSVKSTMPYQEPSLRIKSSTARPAWPRALFLALSISLPRFRANSALSTLSHFCAALASASSALFASTDRMSQSSWKSQKVNTQLANRKLRYKQKDDGSCSSRDSGSSRREAYATAWCPSVRKAV
jgi:hypothetical protein